MTTDEETNRALTWAREEAVRLHRLGEYAPTQGELSAARAFLATHAGPNSPFTRAAEEASGSGTYAGPIAATALDQWAAYVEAGWSEAKPYPVRSRIDGATELLQQAFDLLADATVHEAAPIVLAGAALEMLLRAKVEELGLSPSGRPGIMSFTNCLREAEAISAQDVKDLTAWAGVRNQAAHGDFGALSRERAGLILDGINLFMRQNIL